MKRTDNTSENTLSRRSFFTKGLGAFGGLALGGSLVGCDSGLREGARTFKSEARGNHLPEIDPALITYQEDKRWPLAKENPRKLFLTKDNRLMAVGDQGLEVVPINDLSETTDLEVSDPITAYVETPDGKHRLVADRRQIVDYAADKQYEWPILATNAYVTDLATDGEHIYVADAGSRLFWKFGVNGDLVSKWGEKDKSRNQPGLVVPSPYLPVTVDPEGNVWGANPGRHSINRYDADGNVTATWGRAGAAIEGFCGCCNPTNLIALQDGTGFVTAEKGLPRVKIYNLGGELDCVVAPPDHFEAGMESLAIAANDRSAVYILEPHAAEVRRYVPIA